MTQDFRRLVGRAIGLPPVPFAGFPKEREEPLSHSASRDISDEAVFVSAPQPLGQFYQSQGRLPSGQITNDCGPTNLAMVLNLLAGFGDVTKESVKPYLWQLGWPFPASIRGATPPWSMASTFNNLAQRRGLAWRAQRSSGTKGDLIANVEKGWPSTQILVWEGGGAHYVTVIGYDPEPDTFLMLDPNPWYAEHLPPERRIAEMAWDELDVYWSRQVWWTRLLGIHNETITYSPVEG